MRQRLAARQLTGRLSKARDKPIAGFQTWRENDMRQSPRPGQRAQVQCLGDMPWVGRATAFKPDVATRWWKSAPKSRPLQERLRTLDAKVRPFPVGVHNFGPRGPPLSFTSHLNGGSRQTQGAMKPMRCSSTHSSAPNSNSILN